MDQKYALGSEKFKVPKFVKAALCLAHGNADVENKQTITKERSLLSEESISGLRLTKTLSM